MSYKFPYTNFHELNLDWVMEKLEEMQSKYDSYDTAIEETIEKIDTIRSEFTTFESDINTIISEFKSEVNTELDTINSTLKSNIETLTTKIETLYSELVLKINVLELNLSQDIIDGIEECKAYTRTQLAQLSKSIKVINYFTGESVSIQEMLNYLSTFHVYATAIYNTMIADNLTYSEISDLEYTYTHLIKYGFGIGRNYITSIYYDTATESLVYVDEGGNIYG